MSRAGGADRRSIVIANANAARSLRARRSQRNVYCCLLHVCVSVAAGFILFCFSSPGAGRVCSPARRTGALRPIQDRRRSPRRSSRSRTSRSRRASDHLIYSIGPDSRSRIRLHGRRGCPGEGRTIKPIATNGATCSRLARCRDTLKNSVPTGRPTGPS